MIQTIRLIWLIRMLPWILIGIRVLSCNIDQSELAEFPSVDFQ